MENPVDQLHRLGQSIWYDNIQRGMLENGIITRLIEDGEVRGMTSNPSIFNQAIAGSYDYDEALQTMAWAGWEVRPILDQLIVEDIQAACDLFLTLYRSTGGRDGYVSVEVSPDLAYEAEKTFIEAQRLWKRVNRPNVMIKIPGTREGIAAVSQAIAAGINVNVTLIFSLERYQQVMEAYLVGLEQRIAQGLAIDQIASVASFFVSRIDTKVDQRLESLIRKSGENDSLTSVLRGKLAVASAALAYVQFKTTFESARFAQLRAYGARVQRPVWASTSTKNPQYPDTKYVDGIIYPDTVNTIPPQTLEAFRDHGRVDLSPSMSEEASQQAFADLARLGISIHQITQELEEEGVRAFQEAFHALQNTIASKRLSALKQLGSLAEGVRQRVADLEQNKALERLHQNDPSLWTDDPAGQVEIRKRTGWLELPTSSLKLLADLRAFSQEIKQAGYTRALLLGMGGSSLAPEVMRLIFGVVGGGLDLAILDSTDPAQVRSAARRSPVKRTLFILASKSGGTTEINAFFDYFWQRARRSVGPRAGEHFIAITDPGTALEKLARERNFRRVFLADPKVGGRFSALTLFGLLPASLCGVDPEYLLQNASGMGRQCTSDVPAGRSPGLVLGALLGEAVLQGRDKLTLITARRFAPFGAWLEQLIAESSGKNSTGIIPIDGEKRYPPSAYGTDRLFVYLRLPQDAETPSIDRYIARLLKFGHPVITLTVHDPYDVGREFYRWEVAIAIACAVLRVNAFDQPDVQDSKTRTLVKISAYYQTGILDEGQPWWQGEGACVYGQVIAGEWKKLADLVLAFLGQRKVGDYLAINAYLHRSGHKIAMLQKFRIDLHNKTGLPTTLGFGPRFLHSTGQLHKGGANNGLFLQITADTSHDINIPVENLTFGVLERAQALGDFEALLGRDRRVLRLHFSERGSLFKLIVELARRSC